jgi:hypothetical protein
VWYVNGLGGNDHGGGDVKDGLIGSRVSEVGCVVFQWRWCS